MFRTLAVILAIFASAYGYTPCINVQTTEVDEAFFTKAGTTGLHIPLHSRCNNCENEENWKWVKNEPAAPSPKRKRSINDNIYCWQMVGITQLTPTGIVALSYQCEPRGRIEQQYCAGVIPKVKVDGVSYAGQNAITKTDNSTYVAGVTCMFGRENFWWMAFTTPEAPAETVKSVEEHFRGLGFTAVTATVEHDSPVILKSLTVTQC